MRLGWSWQQASFTGGGQAARSKLLFKHAAKADLFMR